MIEKKSDRCAESCLDCGTPLEMTLAGQKKKPCPKCGVYRRKREYFD